MSRVLIVSSSLLVGGAEIQSVRLANAFAEMGVDSHLMILTKHIDIHQKLKIDPRVVLIELGANRCRDTVLKVRSQLKLNGYSHVLSMMSDANMVCGLATRLLPVKWCARVASWSVSGMSAWLQTCVLIFADLVVFNSSVTQTLSYKYSTHLLKSMVIGNAVDPTYKIMEKANRTQISLGFVARFDVRKRWDRIPELQALLSSDKYVLRLFTVQQDAEAVLSFAPQLTELVCIGAEMMQIATHIDALIVLSDVEGFSSVTIESWACGLPVFSVAKGGIFESDLWLSPLVGGVYANMVELSAAVKRFPFSENLVSEHCVAAAASFTSNTIAHKYLKGMEIKGT